MNALGSLKVSYTSIAGYVVRVGSIDYVGPIRQDLSFDNEHAFRVGCAGEHITPGFETYELANAARQELLNELGWK